MEPNIKSVSEWSRGRAETGRKLNELADKHDKTYASCNKIGAGGAAVGLMGGLAMAGGMALSAPLTGGASVVAGTAAVIGLMTKTGTKVADKYFSDNVMKTTQALVDEDCRNSEEVRVAMTQLCEVEIGIYQRLSNHIQENIRCGGSKMPSMSRSRFKRTNLKGEYRADDLIKAAGVSELLKPPVVQQGLKAVQEQNFDSVQKLIKICMDQFGRADQRAFMVEKVASAARQLGLTGILTPRALMRLADYSKGLGLISAAALPFQVKDLIDKTDAVRTGKEHQISRNLRKKVNEMKAETGEIETHIRSIVTDLSNLILLINFIKRRGCDESLDTLLNMILKEINKAKHLTDALNSLLLHNNTEEYNSDEDEKFEATTMNCEGGIGWPIKELSLWIWCAWKLRCRSVIFLQNTHFTHVPGLWTMFGVSINCFGSETSCGVSILLPLDFPGIVESSHDFNDEIDAESTWNGRCLVVNILYNGEKISLVNMLAPTEKVDRELFIREATKFIRSTATAPHRLITSVDFAREVPTMTLEVPKKVSESLRLSVIKRFIPSQQVSEYLIQSKHVRKRDRDTSAADIDVQYTCYSLNLMLPGKINWFHCQNIELTYNEFDEQLEAFLKLAVTDLWTRKNSGSVEFSTVNKIIDRTVSATRSVHFCVSESFCDEIKTCDFDHIPRILGFTCHSGLSFVCKR